MMCSVCSMVLLVMSNALVYKLCEVLLSGISCVENG